MRLSDFKRNILDLTKIASSWDDIVAFKKDTETLGGNKIWIYRGQSNNNELKTLLERAIKDLNSNDDPYDIEFVLSDRFKRNFYSVQQTPLKILNPVELYALMQHYGTPTRLLDFTYSFYVAAFFALENFKGKSPIIWCIDALWLKENSEEHLGTTNEDFMPGKCKEDFIEYFIKGSNKTLKRAVYQMTPHLLNTRLAIQQGTFLCPCNIKYSFMANFSASLPEGTSIDNHMRVLKIDQQARLNALEELYRMNISRASLFPGLSGFAQSLMHSLVLPCITSGYTDKRRSLLFDE
jgi:FRG domain